MAVTRTDLQVTWPTAANSKSVAAGTSETSEAITIDPTCINARITLKADNNATAASDDQIYFWLIETSGDPDGTGSDEYGTTEHATLLKVLDTDVEDPAIATVQLPLPQDSIKIIADGTTAGTTNAITVSAKITIQKA